MSRKKKQNKGRKKPPGAKKKSGTESNYSFAKKFAFAGMNNPGYLITVPYLIAQDLSQALFDVFPDHRIFAVPNQLDIDEMLDDEASNAEMVDMVISPLLSEEDEAVFESKVKEFISGLEDPKLIYAESFDKGKRRTLHLIVNPEKWQGEAEVFVGPFSGKDEAIIWGSENVYNEVTNEAILPGYYGNEQTIGEDWYYFIQIEG
jgi:hypothetical protein